MALPAFYFKEYRGNFKCGLINMLQFIKLALKNILFHLKWVRGRHEVKSESETSVDKRSY